MPWADFYYLATVRFNRSDAEFWRMTLAQLDALMSVENRLNKSSNDTGGKLPPPEQRNWGTAHDFAQWERRVNG